MAHMKITIIIDDDQSRSEIYTRKAVLPDIGVERVKLIIDQMFRTVVHNDTISAPPQLVKKSRTRIANPKRPRRIRVNVPAAKVAEWSNRPLITSD